MYGAIKGNHIVKLWNQGERNAAIATTKVKNVIAQSAAGANLALLFGTVFIVTKKFRVNFFNLIYAVGRPCLAGVAMYALVTGLPVPTDWPAIAELAARSAAGAAAYPVFLLALWTLSGKPAGAESTILREIRLRLRRP